MKFEKLIINNFLTIGNIECSLDNKGLVLIQGENKDDTSQDSNGSGKSSFPDAILWCLFGSTARGEAGDRVVNRKAKKDCYVEITLTDDDGSHIITRYRKHTVEKSRLTLFSLKGGKRDDLTKGTDKLTQDAIVKILGCSEEVFCAAIYAGQEAMPDLPGMTDKQLKTIVEEAAGIDRLQEAHLIAQRKLREAKSELLVEDTKLTSLKQILANNEDHLVKLNESKDHYEEQRSTTLKTVSNDLRAKKAELDIAAKESEVATKKIESLEEKKKSIQEKIDSVESENQKERELSDAVNKVKTEATKLTSQYQQKATLYKSASEKCKSIHSDVGKPCGECGKTYTEDDMQAAFDLAEEKRKTLRVEAEEIKRATEATVKRVKEASEALSKFRDAMTNVSAEIAQKDDLSAKIATLLSKKTKVDEIKREMVKLITEVKRIKGEANPHTSIIEGTEKAIEVKKKEITQQEKIVDEKMKQIKIAEATEKVFGAAGVRAHILDSVTPFLNHRTAEYLSTLTDENITAIWSTLSTTAKGEIREKFVIDVSSKVGGGNFKSLSGGEKRKVRLSCSMALQDLVSSRASKPIELYIADEIDHALDEAGLERLMSILDEKAKTKGTALIISHNSLNSFIRQSVTIVKEKGQSRLEGTL